MHRNQKRAARGGPNRPLPLPYQEGEGSVRTRRTDLHQARIDRPLVTVITVVRNGSEILEGTILSVLNQSYDNIEYIVIDGASTDRTVDVIKKYDERIACWLSEPDEGIYDAMNKGIKAASGEWINFLNAGDRFYSPDTVETIFAQNHNGAELIYGHQEIVYGNGFAVIRKALPVRDLWKGVICNHQALFAKAALLKEHPFDLSYRIAADFEFVYDAFKRNHKFYFSDTVVASILAAGFSHSHLLQGYKEYKDIVKKYDNGIAIALYYAWRKTFASLKTFLKKILPSKVTEHIISFKNR